MQNYSLYATRDTIATVATKTNTAIGQKCPRIGEVDPGAMLCVVLARPPASFASALL